MNQIAKIPEKSVVPLQALLAKDVSRNEFLHIVGYGALAIAGIGPLIHFLTGSGKNSKTLTHIYRNSGPALSYSRGRYNQ